MNSHPCLKGLTRAIQISKLDPLQRQKSRMFAVQDPFSPLHLHPRLHAEMQEEAGAPLSKNRRGES